MFKFKPVRKRQSMPPDRVKEALERFLRQPDPGLTRFLVRYWKDQQTVFTYKEIREAIVSGTVAPETVGQWQQDYSRLVVEKIAPEWRKAMEAGAKDQLRHKSIDIGYKFRHGHWAVREWIDSHTAEMVTNCTRIQKDAIKALIDIGIQGHIPTRELARYIRPCIGLTKPQAAANLRYCNNMRERLRAEHPRMSAESIEKKVSEAGIKYADRQMRQRAETIARTEKAKAYEYGRFQHTKWLVGEGFLPPQKKKWSSAGNESTCKQCRALDGKEAGMDEPFLDGASNPVYLPPLHPDCRCCIVYVNDPEAKTPEARFQPPITGEGTFRKYTTEEIESIAAQTDAVASRHVSVPSKWSGEVVVDDLIGMTGKQWDCSILTTHEVAPHMLLHEHLHARSISYYKKETYYEYSKIEEATVQLMAQEISAKEGIEIIASKYDGMVKALRRLNRRIGKFQTDYEFAKFLIEMPLVERLDWISQALYDIMGKDQAATVEEYGEMASLLDSLYV